MQGSLTDNTVVKFNTEFSLAHPGWAVNYQTQTWDGIVAKLDLALASNNPPDVIEMGNTQTSHYAAAGELMDLTSSRQALGGGSSNDSASADQGFMASLNDSAMFNGKLFAAGFYGGCRVLVVRKDLLAKANIDPASLTSKDKVLAAAKTLAAANPAKDFSPFYLPGQNWYALMQFIWDEGGQIATESNGTWSGGLSSAASQKGIQDYVDYYTQGGSKGPKDKDEQNPPEWTLFQQGKIAMFIGNWWEVGLATGKTGAVTNADQQVAVIPIPSVNDGKTVPIFVGGSNLGIAAKSKNQAQALDWIKIVTSSDGQNELMGNGWIPGLKAAAASIPSTASPVLKIQIAEAAAGGRATPASPNWASVESGINPLKDMMAKILLGKASIADAAKAADDQIAKTLNAQ
jgi:N,N'-diacetylchitobiose transport system substrate-binding protein